MVLPKVQSEPKKAKGSSQAMRPAMYMKAKRVSKVARGRFAKVLVLRGLKEKTVGGLTQEKVLKNKRGRVVSKRASAHGNRMYRNIQGWTEALMAARKALQTVGFCAVNGKTLQGKALYVKAKALRSRVE